MLRYAAYGSNLHPLRIQRRVASARLIGTAEVTGIALRFHKRGWRDGSGKCNLVVCEASVAHIAVYEIADDDMPRLDAIEGAGRGYHREENVVAEFGRCATYLADPAHVDERLSPYCWYRDLVLAGAEHHGIPDHYCDQIKAVETRRDPDDARHREHTQLLEEIRLFE